MSTLMRRVPSPVSSDDVFSGVMRRLFNEPYLPPTMPLSAWVPAMEVSETTDAMILTAELPGIEEKHLKITIENNVLTIAGEKEQAITDSPPAKNFYLAERFYGAFQRALSLPRTVDVEHVKADFEKGILTITLPKLPQAKGRVIEVEHR
jgi:HSP20 family protein